MSISTSDVITKIQVSSTPTTVATCVLSPLPVSKTVVITFVPDWTQEQLGSSSKATSSMCVVFGPANTLPEQALWSFEFNIFTSDKLPSDVKNNMEETISKGGRALLWYDGKPFPKYQNGIVLSKCRLSANDELKTHSVVLRTHGEERDPNALTWVNKRSGPKRRKDSSYLNVVAGHHYYLNITFAAGSTIAQLVGNHLWRPIIYLIAKRKKNGIDEIQSSQLFTNFNTNWALGIEPNVDERELKLAAEAIQREAQEDYEHRASNISSTSVVKPTTIIQTSPPKNQPLTPIVPYLVPLQIRNDLPVEWAELEAAINTKPLASIVLPSLENRPFKMDFPLDDLLVERFIKPDESTLSQTLNEIETLASTTATNSKFYLSDTAKHFLNTLSAISQLPGWLHVQNYIQNPQVYIERNYALSKGDEATATALSLKFPEGSIDNLQRQAKKVLNRLCQRIDWVLELQGKASKPFAQFFVKVIAADRAWAEEASSFMKEAETKVTEMLTHNPQKFHAFRELQRKGIRWPHSLALRKAVEQAGFVFRPMMIKRDRCICSTCKVEVSGWKSWHNPWSFHNYAKHPPNFQPNNKEKEDKNRAESEANAAREQAEREKIERERAERERIERERAEREQAERERTERERAEHERAERERIERQRAEREQAERNKAAAEAKAKKEQLDKEAEEVIAKQHKTAIETQLVVSSPITPIPMHLVPVSPVITPTVIPLLSNNLFGDQEVAEAFYTMVKKGKFENQQQKERNLILNNENLKEYYISFNERFLGLILSCYSIHSGMVENGSKNAADIASDVLQKGSNALPILGLITTLFGAGIKVINDIDKKHMINSAMAFFRKAIHSSTNDSVSMESFAEVIARRLTIAKFKLIINSNCKDDRGIISAIKDKVTANDVQTEVQQMAFDDIKSLFKIIFNDLKVETTDCAEDLIKTWSNYTYRPLAERTQEFLLAINPPANVSCNGLPMGYAPMIANPLYLTPAYQTSIKPMIPVSSLSNTGVELTNIIPTLTNCLSPVSSTSPTPPMTVVNNGSIINQYHYVPPVHQKSKNKDEIAKDCCVIL